MNCNSGSVPHLLSISTSDMGKMLIFLYKTFLFSYQNLFFWLTDLQYGLIHGLHLQDLELDFDAYAFFVFTVGLTYRIRRKTKIDTDQNPNPEQNNRCIKVITTAKICKTLKVLMSWIRIHLQILICLPYFNQKNRFWLPRKGKFCITINIFPISEDRDFQDPKLSRACSYPPRRMHNS